MASRVKEFPGYRFYNVANAFTFVSQEKMLNKTLHYDLPGPYEIDRDEYFTFMFEIRTDIIPRVDGEKVRQDLIHLAQKLTPQLDELSYEPGNYSFTDNRYGGIKKIKLYPEKACDADSKEQASTTLDTAACGKKRKSSDVNHSSPSIGCESEHSGDTTSPGNVRSIADDFAKFIVGPNKRLITINRAVLAATNPVLKRMLYGVGLIKTDPNVPIVWSEFDAEVVQAVFDTLQNKKDSIFVPSSKVSDAKVFLDFIGEMDQIDVCRSDIGFEQIKHETFNTRQNDEDHYSDDDDSKYDDFVYLDY